MQFRHVCRRQYRHSHMNQNGPHWQTWHIHWISVLSDLIMTNEWAQWPWLARAILSVGCGASSLVLGGVDPGVSLSGLARMDIWGC